MPIFTLVRVHQVKGRLALYKLAADSECYFDMFCDAVMNDGNLSRQIDRIFSLLEQVANLQRLSKEQFRDITPSKELIKEFEVKTRDLRVYMIKEEGHIIVFGGRKSTQREDIRRFRSIKKQYLYNKKRYDNT
jgi:putative component of toxin-antitoxin plasmid stabilization module